MSVLHSCSVRNAVAHLKRIAWRASGPIAHSRTITGDASTGSVPTESLGLAGDEAKSPRPARGIKQINKALAARQTAELLEEDLEEKFVRGMSRKRNRDNVKPADSVHQAADREDRQSTRHRARCA